MANRRQGLKPSRSLIGRLGAHVAHSRNDSREMTRRAREAFARRFEDEVDPRRLLPPHERERRAEHARKAHFERLALKSAQARARAAGRNSRSR